jgi:uncharacterized repeat protein (TIGR01451 family)
MAGFWKQLKNALQGNSIARNEARESARRRLRMELLEGRELFAADIQGTVFHDINNDTQLSPGDTPLSGVVVQLFQDNGDGVYGPTDTLKDSATSAGNGGYTLTAESVGNYFVVQNTQPSGFTQRFAQRVQKVTINNADIAIVDKIVIDTFNTTQQVVNANFPGATPNSSILAAPEALGGERDIFVDATAGTISVSANGTPKPGELVFDVGAGANGKRVVSYDGLDGSASLNSTGLNNLDLTSAGSANAFRFQIGGEAGTRLIIRVYSGANASSREVAIPTTSGANATADLIVPFSDFTSLAGSGANFASVGAIEIEVTGPDAADAIVNTFSTVGPSTRQVNLANLTAMAIGNQVFADRNNNGIWDNTGTNPEVGVPNVQLQLIEDSNNDGIYSPGIDQQSITSLGAPQSTTTSTTGLYAFAPIPQGAYFVIIPASQFANGNPAAGYSVSSVVPPNATNNANTAVTLVGGGAVTKRVVLTPGSAPTTDGDTDANTDNSIDVGLNPNFDLAIEKFGPANTTEGATITYTLKAINNSPIEAKEVVVVDNIPDGLRVISASLNNAFVAVPASAVDANPSNPDNVVFNVGSLAPRASQSNIQIVAAVLTGTSGPSLINSATIATTDATFNETNLDNNRAEVTTLLAARTVDLSGRIYVDVAKNNVSDPTDPGIPGASVFLTGTPFTGTTPVNLLTTTNQNGDYIFNNVQQGNYNVQVSTPPGFSFQSSNPGTTQGTAGFQTIANINLNTNSSLNNIGFTRAFSKRLFLASSAPL